MPWYNQLQGSGSEGRAAHRVERRRLQGHLQVNQVSETVRSRVPSRSGRMFGRDQNIRPGHG